MRWKSLVWLSVVAVCLATPVLAATSTPWSKGGKTKDFAVDVEQYRRSGELFRITGHCQSACTMFLALRNVCVEPSARLLFHAGASRLHAPHDQLLQWQTARLPHGQWRHGNAGVPHHIGPRHDQQVRLPAPAPEASESAGGWRRVLDGMRRGSIARQRLEESHQVGLLL